MSYPLPSFTQHCPYSLFLRSVLSHVSSLGESVNQVPTPAFVPNTKNLQRTHKGLWLTIALDHLPSSLEMGMDCSRKWVDKDKGLGLGRWPVDLVFSFSQPSIPPSNTPLGTLTSYRCPFFRRVHDQSLQALFHSLLLSLQAGLD